MGVQIGPLAPRSSGRNLARGTRFFGYPWREYTINIRAPGGVRGILDTPFEVRFLASNTFQAYAKNAYA
jgi:hypothetical protein